MTLVDPMDGRPVDVARAAEFRLNAFVTAAAPDSVRGFALVEPGVDPTGGRRDAADETLTVNGVPTAPVDSPPGPPWQYRLASRLSATDRVIAIQTPSVQGTTPASYFVLLPLVRQVSTTQITVRPGDDLQLLLEVGTVGREPEEFQTLAWALDVANDSQTIRLTLQGRDGLPPDTITIPAVAFSIGQSGDYTVRLSVFVDRRIGVRNGAVPIDGFIALLSARWELGWTVHVEPPL